MSISNSTELKAIVASAKHGKSWSLADLLGKSGLPAEENRAVLEQIGANVFDFALIEKIFKDKKIIVQTREFAQWKAIYLGLPFVELDRFDVDGVALLLIPAEVARDNHLIPLMTVAHGLVVAMDNPTDKKTLDLLGFMTGYVIEPVVATRTDIDGAITKHYGSAEENDALDDLDIPEIDAASDVSEVESMRLAQEKPTVKLVRHLIIDAVRNHASDIHIRPRLDQVDVLFRIDGVLVKVRSFGKKLAPAIVSRIKVLGKMDVAEHRLPQDGQTRIVHENNTIDLRLSVIPSIYGESVVIRILDKSTSLKSLSDIGFNKHDEQLFSSLLTKSYGLVLVTGPTGCGKSTTLYAALQEIKKTLRNIITVEDPVEYHVDGLMQIQVKPDIGYDFARALRHILRHDPDVIMVGEIRDVETAKMAVESALTGHIVLSTLHTNSAATSVTRLLEMGVDAYLVNTSLLAILAQRLVRKNCTICTKPESVSDAIREELSVSKTEIFYKGSGCDSCHHTGYSGRMAVYELMVLTPQLRQIITPRVSALTIEETAIAQGMVPLTQMALQMAREHKTSLEEVYRVRLN